MDLQSRKLYQLSFEIPHKYFPCKSFKGIIGKCRSTHKGANDEGSMRHLRVKSVLELIQEFLKVQSEEVISRLENILKKENVKSEKERFKPMTAEEFNSRIDQSMKDSKNGRLMESSKLKAKIDKWN